jgi:hypothetical protein
MSSSPLSSPSPLLPLSSQEISRTVKEIRELAKKKRNVESLRDKYIEFVDKYPKLFAAAVDLSFPMTFLEIMLDKLEALNKKEIDLDAADKHVYGELQKTYIDPVIPPTK